MNPDRFKRRTDYTRQPPRRVVPVLDELGELRQVPAGQTATPVPIQPMAQTPPVRPFAEAPIPSVAAPQPPQPLITPPVAHQPAYASSVQSAAATTPILPAAELAPTISVHINLPKLQLPRPTIPKLPKLSLVSLRPLLRFSKWPLLATGTLLLIAGGVLAFKHFASSGAPTSLKTGQATAVAALAQPTFAPAAPKQKPGLAIATAGTSGFDGTKDSYSYKDSLNGLGFVVSQQPLPAKFTSPAQAVSTAAQSLGAKTALTISGGTAYMLADAKSGSQTLIFSVKNLLVFIQSPFTHPPADWASYINSLQ